MPGYYFHILGMRKVRSHVDRNFADMMHKHESEKRVSSGRRLGLYDYTRIYDVLHMHVRCSSVPLVLSLSCFRPGVCARLQLRCSLPTAIPCVSLHRVVTAGSALSLTTSVLPCASLFGLLCFPTLVARVSLICFATLVARVPLVRG